MWCGVLLTATKGEKPMTALSLILGHVYYYADFFRAFGYFPG